MKTLAKLIGLLVVVAVVLVLAARVFGFDPGPTRPGLWLTGEVAPLPADWTPLKATGGLTAIQTHQYFLPWLAHSIITTRFHHNGHLYLGSGYPAGVRLPEGRHWNRNLQSDPRARIRIGGKLYDGNLVYVTDPAERDAIWKEYGPMFWSPGFFLHLWRFEPLT